MPICERWPKNHKLTDAILDLLTAVWVQTSETRSPHPPTHPHNMTSQLSAKVNTVPLLSVRLNRKQTSTNEFSSNIFNSVCYSSTAGHVMMSNPTIWCHHRGKAGSGAASQLKAPWFDHELRLLSISDSHSVHMGFLLVLRFSPTSQKHASRQTPKHA